MSKTTKFLIVLSILLLPYLSVHCNRAYASSKVRILVLDFKSVGDREYFGPLSAENVRVKLKDYKGYHVISRKSLRRVIKGGGIDKVDLSKLHNMLALGKRFAADKIISGSLIKNKNLTHTIKISIIDCPSGVIEYKLSLTSKSLGGVDTLIERMCKEIVKRLPYSQLFKKEKGEEDLEFDFPVDSLGIFVRDYYSSDGPVRKGVAIVHIKPGSLADAARLKKGDIIVNIDDSFIKSTGEYNNLTINSKEKELLFEIFRNGRKLYIGVKTPSPS